MGRSSRSFGQTVRTSSKDRTTCGRDRVTPPRGQDGRLQDRERTRNCTMNQPAMTTLSLITPTQDEPTQVVNDEPTLTALEQRQQLLAHHVRLIARGLSD